LTKTKFSVYAIYRIQSFIREKYDYYFPFQ